MAESVLFLLNEDIDQNIMCTEFDSSHKHSMAVVITGFMKTYLQYSVGKTTCWPTNTLKIIGIAELSIMCLKGHKQGA